MIKRVIKDVSSEHLRKYHKELTKAPHIAGLERDQELTAWIKNVSSEKLILVISKEVKWSNILMCIRIIIVTSFMLGMGKRRSG